MNHVLKSVPANQSTQVASNGDPSLPLAKGLSASLFRLIKIAFKKTDSSVAK